MRLRHSLLFAHYNHPDVHGKAVRSGVDEACFALEHVLPPHAKVETRASAMLFLCDLGGGPKRSMPINGPQQRIVATSRRLLRQSH
jgi:hypothetical protein